jgi:hypothetical protein
MSMVRKLLSPWLTFLDMRKHSFGLAMGLSAAALMLAAAAGAGETPRPGLVPANSGPQIVSDGAIDVRAFGALGNGMVDDTSAVQRAFAAAVAGHRPLYLPPGTYKVTGLDFTGVAGIRIYGAGAGATSQHGGAQTDILIQQTTNAGGIGLDLAGSSFVHLANLRIRGGPSPANAPKVLVLMGKATTGPVGGEAIVAEFDNVIFQNTGPFGVYDLGGEQVDFHDCEWIGTEHTIGGELVLSSANSAAISSPHITLRKPPISMGLVSIEGGATMFTTNGDRAIVFDEASNDLIENITLDSVYVQLVGDNDIAIQDLPGATASVSRVMVRNLRIEALTKAGTASAVLMHGNAGVWDFSGGWNEIAGRQKVLEFDFAGGFIASRMLWDASPLETSGPSFRSSDASGSLIQIMERRSRVIAPNAAELITPFK